MTPNLLYLIAGLLFLALIVVLSLLLKGSGGAYQRVPILTGNEREFFSRLRQALPGRVVLVQVSLAALIQPTATRGSKRHLMDFRRISQKRADFVVCDTKMNVLAVVELDDRTHNYAQDAIRDSYLASAGIRTIRYESKNKPSKEAIAAQFASLSE